MYAICVFVSNVDDAHEIRTPDWRGVEIVYLKAAFPADCVFDSECDAENGFPSSLCRDLPSNGDLARFSGCPRKRVGSSVRLIHLERPLLQVVGFLVALADGNVHTQSA
uniref:AlNc14C566G12161 protein n=1 Tax=Albugo laibachii Nc14 TaxID=890382 RepID=F0X168_9STRA|nr:AlNc14C566G12161 [Albugo laibachii Nc14]|eukprot:CCA27525.1 AlNc14C566G12161 [Albugo laibachii Nc14]